MTALKPHLQPILRHPAIWRGADTLRATECWGQQHKGIPSGYAGLDQALPDGGWPDSGIAEVLCPHWGCGEAELLAPMLQLQSQQARWVVWINPPWIPYAPALAQQGIALGNTLFLRCNNDKDVLWAMEQCLASGSCSVVQGWPANPQPQQIRRLQLAAQKGHNLGILLRPSRSGQQPSPAPLRLELGPLQQELQVRIVKCRGRWGSDWLQLKTAVAPLQDTLPALLPTGNASLTSPQAQPQAAKASIGTALQPPSTTFHPTARRHNTRLNQTTPITAPQRPTPSGG